MNPARKRGLAGLVLVWLVLGGCAVAPEPDPAVLPQADQAAGGAAATGVSDPNDPGSERAVVPAGASGAGDLDGNNVIDAADKDLFLVRFERAFGSTGGAAYDPLLDMDGDGQITWADLQAFVDLVG